MKSFKEMLVAAALALAITVVASAAHAGMPTPVSKCQDFACQN